MDQDSNRKEQTSAVGESRGKKPYQSPTLTRWGSLRDLTMTNHGGGKYDGSYKKYTGRGGRHVIVGRS